MIIRFNDEDTTKIMGRSRGALTPANMPAEGERAAIPRSGDVAGIELRMLPPYIRNNKTPQFWFFPGNARLYCLTMVISDAENQLKGLMDLNAFNGIGDEEFLPLNKTIFYWEKETPESIPPNQVHVMTSIIKARKPCGKPGIS